MAHPGIRVRCRNSRGDPDHGSRGCGRGGRPPVRPDPPDHAGRGGLPTECPGSAVRRADGLDRSCGDSSRSASRRYSTDVEQMEAACPNRMDPPAAHLPTDALDRMEICRGPFTFRYGPAFGGVLHLVEESRSPMGRPHQATKSERWPDMILPGRNERLRARPSVVMCFKRPVNGAYATGDYKAGDGSTVPAGFNRDDAPCRSGPSGGGPPPAPGLSPGLPGAWTIHPPHGHGRGPQADPVGLLGLVRTGLRRAAHHRPAVPFLGGSWMDNFNPHGGQDAVADPGRHAHLGIPGRDGGGLGAGVFQARTSPCARRTGPEPGHAAGPHGRKRFTDIIWPTLFGRMRVFSRNTGEHSRGLGDSWPRHDSTPCSRTPGTPIRNS
jgi:hypothetical protein